MGSIGGSTNLGGGALAAGGQSAPNTPTTGGVYVATTGSTSTSGGASTASGTTASGGKASSGGTAALGGKTGSGGGQTGGTHPGSGGVRSSGGTTAAGGSAKGGTTSSTSTATGTGGFSATTPGCGKSSWPLTNDQTGGTPYTLTIDGTAREFYVNVPTTYQPSQPIRVVFAWHWLTATARSVIGGGFGGGAYYGLKSRIPNAIYIAAEGLGDNGQTGWANTNGRDIAFLRAMLDWLDANYCIDKSRIFSVGFSYGGIMSDTIACQLGNTFRAVAPIAGSMFGGARGCINQPVAAHVIHGSADATLNISGGIAARDYFITTNHCTTTSQPLEPSPCVEYSGCDAGYPVVWCEHTGGHTVPSFASAAIATFFQRF
jgi:predicted esterase